MAIPFGLRHGASACQRVSEAASAIAKEEHGAETRAYIDATAGAAVETEADSHYNGLLSTHETLGLEVAPEKCQPPSVRMTWVGVTYDCLTMTMHIEQSKIDDAIEISLKFLQMPTITLHEMQKYLGKLFHATKCTTSARSFMSRLLDLLRAATSKGKLAIPDSAKWDAYWVVSFLNSFNGVTLIKPDIAQEVAYVDSCLTGAGALFEGRGFYALEYPKWLQAFNFNIAALECFNLLMCVRAWIQEWRGKNVLIFCDNWATVCSAESGRAEEPLIRSSLHEFWWLTALHDVHLEIRHCPGADMEVADLLSRAHTTKAHQSRFISFIIHHLKVASPCSQSCSHHL